MNKVFKRLAISETDAAVESRTVSFVFATPSVALDGHRILSGAWESRGHDGLSEFRENPVFLWAHKIDEPPVGRVVSIAERDGVLKGDVEFADTPFADTIFRLYRDGFMRGASVSWLPIEWSYATGRDRVAKAVDFTKVRLLEISAVPIPADSSALSIARSLGLERSAPKWKCGSSLNLEIVA